MRGSAVVHVENNYEGIVAHTSDVISLLPVAQQAATEPESSHPGSASLVSRTAYPDLSPGIEDTSQDSLTHLHNQYIRANRHKSGSTVRSLRNLACRRARQSDMRNVNFVLEEQCTTEDFKTTVGSETLDRRQPTVRVERLGRIVPTSNGSYHILDTSRLESSSYVSARSFRVDGEVARVCTEMDRVSGAVDGVSGAYDVTDGGDFVNDGYSSMVDLDSANNSSQNEKISSGKSQNFRNSTFESRSWERDLTFDTVRNSHACPENISTNGKSFQNNVYQDWQPLYENISDPDSEPDSIKGTEPLQEIKCELVSTKHVNLDCDIPKDYEDRSRDSEVKKRKTLSVNKRRHSAPDHSERRRKKEKQKERHRRLSFNTETDMPQTDHIEPTNKPYLSRLVLCKDAKVKSWNVVIDLAHDEKTTDDEFKAPALPLLNNITLKEGNGNAEKKETVRAITEDSSSDIEDSAKESRASNEKTKSWDYSSYELNQEMKIEDEDTIEAPRGFFSVPKDHVTNTCSSESAKKECSLPNETVGVVTKSLGTKLKVENTVPTIDTLSADKSNLEVLRVTDSLERFSVDNSIVAKIERDEFVKGVSCNSANSMHVEEYSGLQTQNQNTDIASERSIDPGELRGSLGSDASGNKVSGVGRRGSFQEGPSGTASDDAARKVNFSNRTADSLLANSENVSSVGINSATTESSAPSNNVGWSRNFEERVHPGRKMNDKILESGKEEVYKNFENHPSLVSKTMPSQQSITGEENFTKRSFENNNASISSRSHNPVNCGQDNEVDNYGADTDVELSIDESKVDRTTDHAHMKHCAGVQIDSENTTEDLKTARESHDLTSGNSGFVSSKMKKKKRRRKELIISMERRKHEEKKETPSDNYRIHKKTRFSRRSFRHDSIQMFKVSTAFPPHTTLVPWRYKCKKPELPDPVDTRDVNPPSPVLNPIPTQSRFDDNVTNIELEDIPSPGSLTIDLGEQNTNTPDTSDTKEEEGSRKKCNSDGSGGEEETVSRHRSRTKSSESDSVRMKEKATLDASTENDQEHPQSGDLDSDYSNEGQSKTKRKSMKKRKSVDSTVTADVMQHIFTAQMQEKGRRLAQELPGFNWLEEKIRNGGVSTVLTPRRLSGTTCSSSNGGSTVDTSSTDMRAVPTSDAAAVVLSPHVYKSTLDAARSNEPPLSSSPTEYRHSKRLQEYLSSPPKRAKQVSPVASELENQRQALVSARSAHEHGETLRAPATSAPMPTLQRLLHCPQLKSPRQIQSAHTVPEREPSPHQQQSSRRPVIVMASELSKRSDVSPLLQQLTCGGELEVTLSTLPTSSSASSDSGVGSASSHRTSSDAEQTEVTHISVKPVHGRNGPQNADERPSDSTPSRSVGYGVDHLSQFHQPEKNSFVPQDRIPVHVWNREPPQWQGVSDVSARKVHERTAGNLETVPPCGNPDRTYSDRIATMARHASTSFDTGFGIGLGASQEAGHQVPRYIPHRPSDSTHQQTTYQTEHMLKTSGYMPPLVQQPGIFYTRLPQHGLYHPSYVVPQQPGKPHIVRPSAQYPAGVRPYCPPPACLQTVTAVGNSQDLIPGILKCNNSLNVSQPSISSHSSQGLREPRILPTISAVPSSSSTSVQEVASVAQNHTQTSGLQHQARSSDSQIEDSGPENQAETADHQNQGQTCDAENQEKTSDCQNKVQASDRQIQTQASDSPTKDKNPPKDLEEIRKAAEAAAEELEKLEQLKQTTKKDLQRLKLAHEQAVDELARMQKQLVETVGVHKLGQTIHPRPAVPSATAAATRSSLPELYETLPAVSHERCQSPVVHDNHQSAQTLSNAAAPNGHSIPELHTVLPSVTQENCQSTVASEKCQSGDTHKNRLSAVTHEYHRLGISFENETRQESIITSDCSGSSTSGFNSTFPAVAKVNQPTEVECKNQQSEVACGSLETQQKPSVSSDSNEISVPRLNTTFSKVVWENQPLQIEHKNHQKQQKPNGTSDSTGSVTPDLCVTVRKDAHENHLRQQKFNVSSYGTGSLPGLNLKFKTVVYENQKSEVARENQQSDTAFTNHKTHQTPSVTSESTGSSVPGVNTFPAVVPVNLQSEVVCEHQQSEIASKDCKAQQKLGVTPDIIHTGTSMPGSNMLYPKIACDNHHSERLNSTVSTVENSVPTLFTPCATTGHQNQEPVQRPLPLPPSLLSRSQPPVPISVPQQRSPSQTLPVSQQISHSQSRPVPHLQTHSMVLPPHPFPTLQRPQHSQPASAVHQPIQPQHPKHFPGSRPSVHQQLSYVPQRPFYPHLSPVPQTSLQSQSETSTRFKSLPVSQRPPYSQLSPVSRISPHSHSLPVSRISPHSHSLPVSRISPHSHSLPVSQISPHTHSLPVSQISPHSQLSPVSQMSRPQQGSLSHPPLHRQTLQVPQHSPSGNQPLQLSTDQLRGTANIPKSSLEMLETKNKSMLPPPMRQQHVLPKPPWLSGSHIPISVHSGCTSFQSAPATITVHSKRSPSNTNVPQGSSTQHPLTISQVPPVLSHTAIISSSTSNKLPSSTVEESPLDLSVSKRKSPSNDKSKPPVPISSTVLSPYQHIEQSSRHHQDRSQNQPSVVHHPNLGEHNTADHCGRLYNNHRLPQSHNSQHISENSRLEQQLPMSTQTCNKKMFPSHGASIPTVNFATVNDGFGRRPNIHPTSSESLDRYKHLETHFHQNFDNGSVLQRQRVHVPTHRDMMHYHNHPVQSAHQYHTDRPTPSSSYIPVHHKTGLHGHKSEQQQQLQRNDNTEPHAASERQKYCSVNRRGLHSIALTPDKSYQNARSVESALYQPHSQLVCGRCNQPASFMCSACHNEWYCSSDCQLRHWNYHSADCHRQQQNEHK